MPFFTKYNVYSFISNFMWNFFLTLPTIQRMNKWIFLCLAGISIQTQAQQSNFLQEYRAKVKEYNQDTTVQRNFPIESTDHHRSFSSDVLV